MSSLLPRLSRLTAPAYTLTVDGLLGSSTLSDRLLSLSVTLNNGESSDQLSLSLDDRPALLGGGISLPRQGAILTLSMGYETYKSEMGSFEVNQVNISSSGSGRGLTVSATPALLLTEKVRTWSGEIGDIVKKIAAENKLDAAVSPSFNNTHISTVNQWRQSDGAFLTHLAGRYGAVCKPMAGRLLFMKKGEGTSATGKPMVAVAIKPQDILNWSVQITERQDYNRVIAYYPDLRNAREEVVVFPAGQVSASDTFCRLPHSYNTKEEAEAAAKAKFDELNRGDKTLSLSIIGDPDITAEGKITLKDVRSDVDGDYIVKSATHSLSSGGYTTSIQAYVQPD